MFWLILSLLIIAFIIASFFIFRIYRKKAYEGRGTTIQNNPNSSLSSVAARQGRGANFATQKSSSLKQQQHLSANVAQEKSSNHLSYPQGPKAFNQTEQATKTTSQPTSQYSKPASELQQEGKATTVSYQEQFHREQLNRKQPRVNQFAAVKNQANRTASTANSQLAQVATTNMRATSPKVTGAYTTHKQALAIEELQEEKRLQQPTHLSKEAASQNSSLPSNNPYLSKNLHPRDKLVADSQGYSRKHTQPANSTTHNSKPTGSKNLGTSSELARENFTASPNFSSARSESKFLHAAELPQELANKNLNNPSSQALAAHDLEHLKELSSKKIFDQNHRFKLSDQDEASFKNTTLRAKQEEVSTKTAKRSPFAPPTKTQYFPTNNLVDKIVDVVNSSNVTDIDKTIMRRNITTDSNLNFQSSQARRTHPNDDISTRQAKAKEEEKKLKAKAQNHRELSLTEEQKAAQKAHQVFKEDHLTPEQKLAKALEKKKAQEAKLTEAQRQAELAKALKEEEERQKAEKLRISQEVAKNPALLVTNNPKDFVEKIGLINLDPRYSISKSISILKKRKDQNNSDKRKHDKLGKLNFYDAIDSAINTAIGYLEAYKEAFGDITPKVYMDPESDFAKEERRKAEAKARELKINSTSSSLTTNTTNTENSKTSLSASQQTLSQSPAVNSSVQDQSTRYAMASLTNDLASDYKQKTLAKAQREEQALQEVAEGRNPSLQSNIDQEVSFETLTPELPLTGEGFEVISASPTSLEKEDSSTIEQETSNHSSKENDPFEEAKKKTIFQDIINLYLREHYPQYSTDSIDRDNSALPSSEFFEEVTLSSSILDFALKVNVQKADLPAIIESYVEIFESKTQEIAAQQANTQVEE